MKKVKRAAMVLMAAGALLNPVHAGDKPSLLGQIKDKMKAGKDGQPCDCTTSTPVTTSTGEVILTGNPPPAGLPMIVNGQVGPDRIVPAPSEAGAAASAPVAVGQTGSLKVNSKHLQLSYEVKEAGPSGVMGVEVWYTRDGQAWAKAPGGIQRESPYYVDVEEEGTYGFILVARNGFGGGKEPMSGDPAQIWVEVDSTKPTVFLTNVAPGTEGRTLNVKWTASDKNLGHRPINIYYAELTGTTWMPLAVELENSGSYTWQIPPSTPATFRLRVDAVDMAGNVGTAESSSPVQVDLTHPKVSNVRLGTVDK